MSTYEVRGDDRAVPLRELPRSCSGAPLPVVLSDEHRLVVAYLTDDSESDGDGTPPKSVTPDTQGGTVALVTFSGYRALYFGAPNDEAFAGHPLAERGLRRYGAFVVEPSSWIALLSDRNSVHPLHSPALFAGLKHFVLTFHDSTFECVAEGFRVETRTGSVASAIPRMAELLHARR